LEERRKGYEVELFWKYTFFSVRNFIQSKTKCGIYLQCIDPDKIHIFLSTDLSQLMRNWVNIFYDSYFQCLISKLHGEINLLPLKKVQRVYLIHIWKCHCAKKIYNAVHFLNRAGFGILKKDQNYVNPLRSVCEKGNRFGGSHTKGANWKAPSMSSAMTSKNSHPKTTGVCLQFYVNGGCQDFYFWYNPHYQWRTFWALMPGVDRNIFDMCSECISHWSLCECKVLLGFLKSAWTSFSDEWEYWFFSNMLCRNKSKYLLARVHNIEYPTRRPMTDQSILFFK
jgi:hypothetical protein